MKKKQCDKCDKSITVNNFHKHYKSCNGKNNNTITVKEEWKVDENQYKCPTCKLVFTKKGIGVHIWRKHGDGINHNPNIGYETKNRIVWNKGLTKHTDERINKQAERQSIFVKNNPELWINNRMTDKQKEELANNNSIRLSTHNPGGKCKWIEYTKPNGTVVQLQGSWEVRFAKVLDVIDENWDKPKLNNIEHSFTWIDDENKEHLYSPDFYSPKLNKYFEVKGYWWGNDKEKMKRVIDQNKDTVIEIVRKKDLESYEKLILYTDR